MRRSMLYITVFILALGGVPAHAQSTGLKGFFHRAAGAIKHTAERVVGAQPKGNTTTSSSATPSTSIGTATTGPIYRPIRPSHPGEFKGLFDHFRTSQNWPRASVKFVKFGKHLPCWTAKATIWHSRTRKRVETFQVCNAPIYTTDELGNKSVIDETSYFYPRHLDNARNVPGISKAQTSNTRNAGPNPPEFYFALNIATPSKSWQSGYDPSPFSTQYAAMITRLAWISGYINHQTGTIDTMVGRTLWIAGFDPAGNADRQGGAR